MAMVCRWLLSIYHNRLAAAAAARHIQRISISFHKNSNWKFMRFQTNNFMHKTYNDDDDLHSTENFALQAFRTHTQTQSPFSYLHRFETLL